MTDDPWPYHRAPSSPRLDTDMREDAFELFMAEAARVRLQERSGPVRVSLRSGMVLTGELASEGDEAVSDHLALIDADDRRILIPLDSVVWLTGASAALRDESVRTRPRSLTSRLRERWAFGERLRVLLGDARWIDGAVVLVAADHIELVVAGEQWVVPYTSAEAWDLGRVA